MRFNVFIVACAICLASEAALRFTAPVWRPDLGLSLPCLEGAVGIPVDLPRASAYLVTDDGVPSLEDRFDTYDLWMSRTVRGRWRDGSGNFLYVARLTCPPPSDAPGVTRTRRSYQKLFGKNLLNPKDLGARDEAVACAAPVDVGRAVPPRRARRPNFTDLVVYATTNANTLVYAFRPRSPERMEKPDWYLVALRAAEGSDPNEVQARFDEEFLDRVSVPARRNRGGADAAPRVPSEETSERDLLRADVRAQVANYDEWESVDAEDVTVLDDLDAGTRARFVGALTNDLPRFRQAYAARVPSPLSGTNALAVLRVFRNREEYLAHVGLAQKWTEAVWSPSRRELALYHSEKGMERLLRTVWHEAFHQYLAYAGSMLESSPWFNEGHAQLFENAHVDRQGQIVFERDAEAAAFVHEYAEDLAEDLPTLFAQDYDEFYAGSPEDVAVRYRLAWSIAYFLEVGAPKLRFQPYATFRADYLKHLVETKSMAEATQAVLGDEKSRDAFVAAWLAFWRKD